MMNLRRLFLPRSGYENVWAAYGVHASLPSHEEQLPKHVDSIDRAPFFTAHSSPHPCRQQQYRLHTLNRRAHSTTTQLALTLTGVIVGTLVLLTLIFLVFLRIRRKRRERAVIRAIEAVEWGGVPVAHAKKGKAKKERNSKKKSNQGKKGERTNEHDGEVGEGMVWESSVEVEVVEEDDELHRPRIIEMRDVYVPTCWAGGGGIVVEEEEGRKGMSLPRRE